MSMDDKLTVLPSAEPDSQFLPNSKVQFAWDSVSLTSILACPRRYEYSIIRGLHSKNPNYAIALVFGILFHKGLELYQQHKAAGADHHEASKRMVLDICALPATATLPADDDIDEMQAAHDPDEDDGVTLRNSKIRTRYYLMRSLIWYVEHYKDDPAQTIMLASGKPAVELSFRVPLELDGVPHPLLLCGHLDRGVEFNDRLYVMDHKTTKSLTSQFFDMFNLSHQMTGYTLAGGVIFDRPVKGAIVDGVALQVGQVKFGRANTMRTKGQIGEYLQTLAYANQQAMRFAADEYYPMNTSSCYFCDFRSICSQAPEFRAGYIKQHFIEKRGWNPLENR